MREMVCFLLSDFNVPVLILEWLTSTDKLVWASNSIMMFQYGRCAVRNAVNNTANGQSQVHREPIFAPFCWIQMPMTCLSARPGPVPCLADGGLGSVISFIQGATVIKYPHTLFKPLRR